MTLPLNQVLGVMSECFNRQATRLPPRRFEQYVTYITAGPQYVGAKFEVM